MRTLFIITCLANIVFAFGTLPWMPEKVAIHFGPDKTPNEWVSPLIYAILASTLVGVLGAAFFGLSSIPFTSTTSYGTPNRDYWLKEENRPKVIQRLRFYFLSIGIGVLLVLLSYQWTIFHYNRTLPPYFDASVPFCCSIIFAVYVPIEIVRSYLFFRLPKGKE